MKRITNLCRAAMAAVALLVCWPAQAVNISFSTNDVYKPDTGWPQEKDDDKVVMRRIARNTSETATALGNGTGITLSSSNTVGLTVDSPLPVTGVIRQHVFLIPRHTGSIITNHQILAPLITITNVALSSTNKVSILNFTFLSGDPTTTNDFRLHVFKQPVTWGDTGAVFNAVSSEMATNFLATIDSTKTSQGEWSDLGLTNRTWNSFAVNKGLTVSSSNTVDLGFEAAATVTNAASAWGILTTFQN